MSLISQIVLSMNKILMIRDAIKKGMYSSRIVFKVLEDDTIPYVW